MTPPWTLAFDVGGTFVDAVARHADGTLHTAKQARGHGVPAADAVLGALDALRDTYRIPTREVGRIVHGTTVVTNLLAERRLAHVAWVTTAGHADALRLGRQQRRALYAAVPLPRNPAWPDDADIVEVPGRIDAQGREVQPLDLTSLDRAVDRWAREATEGRPPIEACGIALLFAHRNPSHEQAVAARITAALPGMVIAMSHEVDPRPREFERGLATWLEAGVRPHSDAYLDALAHGLSQRGLPAPTLMRADGVLVDLPRARQRPLGLALSGPAAALEAVAAAGDAPARPRPATAASGTESREPPSAVVTLDIGGTTADIGLVVGGRALQADHIDVAGLVLRQRSADISSLPVGGGSRLSLLAGAALRVGPESQGAVPGPACYGRGGTVPTLSDALCVLGRLPTALAGGLPLHADRATQALQPLAEALNTDLSTLAQAAVDTAAARIAEGVKDQAYGRGMALRDAVLVAGGGGGGQHAAEVAALCGIGRVRIPAQGGLLAAIGLLAARPGAVARIEPAEGPALLDDRALRELSARLEAQLHTQQPAPFEPPRAAPLACTLSLAYDGQDGPLELAWAADDNAAALRRRFDDLHLARRGTRSDRPVVWHAAQLDSRTTLTSTSTSTTTSSSAVSNATPTARPRTSAEAAWPGVPTQGDGPRSLCAPTQTVWVPAGWHWALQPDGDLLLHAPAALPAATSGATHAAWALEPLQLTLQGMADRMQTALQRAAVSVLAREAGDCAAALFLPDGRLLVQSHSLPLLLGSLIPAVAAILERHPVASMRDGDGYLLNDPWAGGSHLPDLVLLQPAVVDGQVRALAVTVLHHQDVGGISPGSVPPHATHIDEEGLRLSPQPSHRDGRLIAALADRLRAASRTPDVVLADLDAQWAAGVQAGRELAPLVRRLGAAFEAGADALIAQAEALTRAALAATPDDSVTWREMLDGDGTDDRPALLQLTLEKRGDSLRLDFDGTAAQSHGPVNASPASMLSAALYFMRTLAPEAPNNAGCLRPLTVHLPEGTIVNPRWPAAVNARTAIVKRASNALLAAWGQLRAAHGGASMAAHAGVAVVLSVGGQRDDGTRYHWTEIIASGAGAHADGPGAPGLSTDVGNARSTPAEVIEAIAPVQVEAAGRHRGSGGSGLHHGGDGVRRVYRWLEGQAEVSYRGERHGRAATGQNGGWPGGLGQARVVRADGGVEALSARARVTLRAGDRLVIETAGGGGWGRPAQAAGDADAHADHAATDARRDRSAAEPAAPLPCARE